MRSPACPELRPSGGWVVDAHVHVAPAGAGVGTVDSPFGPVPTVTADLAAYRRTAASAGVDQAVLVQPAALGFDHSHLLACLRDGDRQLAGTALVDPHDPAQLERLLADDGGDQITAVRFVPLLAPAIDWFGSRSEGVLDVVRRHGLVVCVLVGPAGLAPLASWSVDHPDQPVVVDHLGRPDLGDGADGADKAIEALRDLAQQPQTHVKVSALTHLAARLPEPVLREVVDTAVDAFGPARVMWGSDYPFLSPCGYRRGLRLAAELLAELCETDRALMMHDTARRVFGLAVAPYEGGPLTDRSTL